MALDQPSSWLLEASTSSRGFWQAKVEFPPQTESFHATKVMLGTAILWRDQSTTLDGAAQCQEEPVAEMPRSHAGR